MVLSGCGGAARPRAFLYFFFFYCLCFEKGNFSLVVLWVWGFFFVVLRGGEEGGGEAFFSISR